MRMRKLPDFLADCYAIGVVTLIISPNFSLCQFFGFGVPGGGVGNPMVPNNPANGILGGAGNFFGGQGTPLGVFPGTQLGVAGTPQQQGPLAVLGIPGGQAGGFPNAPNPFGIPNVTAGNNPNVVPFGVLPTGIGGQGTPFGLGVAGGANFPGGTITGAGGIGGVLLPNGLNPQQQFPCAPGCGLAFPCAGCPAGVNIFGPSPVTQTVMRNATMTMPMPSMTMPMMMTMTMPMTMPTMPPTTTTTTTTTTTSRPPAVLNRTTTTVYYVYPSWCSSWCQFYYKPKPQPKCILYSWLGIGGTAVG